MYNLNINNMALLQNEFSKKLVSVIRHFEKENLIRKITFKQIYGTIRDHSLDKCDSSNSKSDTGMSFECFIKYIFKKRKRYSCEVPKPSLVAENILLEKWGKV